MHLQRLRRASLALALTSLAACGGSTDPQAALAEGHRALGSNDNIAAAKSYEAALANASGAQIAQAKLGLAKATAAINPNTSKAHALDLIENHADTVTDTMIYDVADRLRQNAHFDVATDLLERGKSLYPDSKALDELGIKLANQASTSSDPALLERLKGLGYLGD
ncbi:MAG: hypothetical protein WD226_09475 [Planctomycetota bacterium]